MDDTRCDRNRIVWEIDYPAALAAEQASEYGDLAKALPYELSEAWVSKYLKMTPAEHDINVVARGSVTYIYDFTTIVRERRQDSTFVWGADVEDRTVVAYGRSRQVRVKRDMNRMRGPRGEREIGQGSERLPYDRGHLLAHSIGGEEDMGLFPQRSDINRGHSARGRVFRRMERYCFDNPGTFVFARPVYLDKTSHPYYLEYGILLPGLSFWIEVFPNRYTDRLFVTPSDWGVVQVSTDEKSA